jgi:toxin ParE1/3/4
MPPFVFHRLAQAELNDAAQYYERQAPGLGLAFVDEVERCLQRIGDHPDAGMLVAGSIRRRLVDRFPYAILYRVRDDAIRVLAVMNLKRRPNYWTGRR